MMTMILGILLAMGLTISVATIALAVVIGAWVADFT